MRNVIKSSREFYTYIHRAGYGSTDHLADEVIDRALRILGDSSACARIAGHAGFASRSVPATAGNIELAATAENQKKMKEAVAAAIKEMPCRVDCSIEVAKVREQRGIAPEGIVETQERWQHGRGYVPYSRNERDLTEKEYTYYFGAE